MRIALAILALLVPLVAWADIDPAEEVNLNGWTKEGKICVDWIQQDVICQRNSDEVVVDLRGFRTVTFDSTESSATTYTCDVYSNSLGYDADNTGHDITATQISNTNKIVTLEGVFRYVWILCETAITGGNVDIIYTASRY